MKHKITRRLILYFALVLLAFSLLIGVLFSSLFLSRSHAIYVEDLIAHAESIARTIAQFTQNYSAGACSGGGFKAYFSFIADVARSEIWVVDAQRQPIQIGNQSQGPVQSELPEGYESLVSLVFETNGVHSLPTNPSAHMGDLVVGVPIQDENGAAIFALLLRRPINQFDMVRQDALLLLTLCLTFALALGVLLSILLSHRFITPLKQMINATMKMMDGHYETSTGVKQSDELGALARHIDALSARLQAAKQQRQKMESMRTAFFSDISHELRTPLSVLKGSLEVLSEDLIPDPDEKRAYCRQMLADTQHTEMLVTDMLELSRPRDSCFHIQLEAVNLVDVLLETVRFIRRPAQARSISVSIAGCLDPCPVMGDYGRLRQLFIILLDNAVKFSPEGSGITLELKQFDGCVVTVRDEGVGIAAEDLPYIFDRFYHKRSGVNQSGSGLGLPIAREIALRHHIELTCESTLGMGTCLTLTFPREANCPGHAEE